MKKTFLLIASVALALCACNRMDLPDNQEKTFGAASEAPLCTFNISASLDSRGTKALTLGESTASSQFADTDSVYVYIEAQRGGTRIIACGFDLEFDEQQYIIKHSMASLTLSNINGATCDLSGALKFYSNENWWYDPFTPEVNDVVYLFYNMLGAHSPLPYNDFEQSSFHYDNQTAAKDGYVDTKGYGVHDHFIWGANHFDLAEAKMKITKVEGDADSGYTLTLVQYADETESNVSFKNLQAQFRQRL